MRSVLIVFAAFVFSPLVLAEDYLEQLQAEATMFKLEETDQWQALLYYKKRGLTHKLESEVDDENYFFSEQGRVDSKSELIASLAAFFSDSLGENHPQCRFPARFHWLSEALAIEKNQLPQPNCGDFNQWFDEMDAGGATIIFPAAYLNSPSSMFGHTLLRLDQRNQNESNRILAYSVSYAASKAEDDSELLFVYRGLVGGYPGDTAILPYYMKLKEYNDIESRDIWEYRLDLTQQQTDQLVRHIWEIKDTLFDYYFFTENCSYRVLGMLDVVLPEQRMREQFNVYTIPIDTVRLPFDRGLVSDVAFRPSVMTRFKHYLGQLTKVQKQMAFKLVMGGANDFSSVDQLPPKQKNAVLDVAYEFSRMVDLPGREAAKTAYRLLRARQNSDGGGGLTAVPMPVRRVDEGHLSSRIRVGLGRRDNNDFFEFQLRPAYHDLTDPALGYPLGSELKFFEITARAYENNDYGIEDLTLIGIKSLKERTAFFKPMSWAVFVGASRVNAAGQQALVPRLAGQLGPAYRLGDILFYGLGGGELQLSTKLDENYDVRGLFNVGLLWRWSVSQVNVEFEYSDSVLMTTPAIQTLSYEQVFNLGPKWAVNLRFDRLRYGENYLSEGRFGFQYYY